MARASAGWPLHVPQEIVSLIDDKAVIERILRHLGLWQQGVRVATGPEARQPTGSSNRAWMTPLPPRWTYSPVSAMLITKTSLRHAGSGLPSACTGRYRPKSDFLSIARTSHAVLRETLPTS